MSSQSDITIRIAGDHASAAQSISQTAKMVEGLGSAVRGVSRVMGFWGLGLTLITKAGDIRKALQAAREEARGFGKDALKAAEDAKALGFTASALLAIKQAASDAGVEADVLATRLREYAEFKLTFNELATAIGATGQQLRELERQVSGGRVGTDWLAAWEGETQGREASGKRRKAERAGLRQITGEIAGGRGTPREAAGWDRLMDAAGGDAAAAGELYNRNKSTWNRTSVGVLGFGDQELAAAARRYQERQSRAEAERAERLRQHDARVQERRMQAAAEAEKKAAAARATAEAAAQERESARRSAAYDDARRREDEQAEREAEALRTREAARAQVVADTAAKVAAVTVEAPRAATAAGSIGGILGGTFNASERMRAQREAAIEALTREQVALLAKIDAKLSE